MLAIVIPIDLFLLGALITVAAFFGYIFRSSQLNRFKRKINDLENEMLGNHADILDLQKQKVQLEQMLNEPKIPVIPLPSAKEEKKTESLQELALRKKMLSQQPIEKHS